MNKIFKIVIQLKELVQSIHRILLQNPVLKRTDLTVFWFALYIDINPYASYSAFYIEFV